MAKTSSHVEVGYLEKPEKEWILESRFFPSKVGGKPAWLDLKNIPANVTCDICLKSCVFLCQVYAPIDNQDHAYHRTIYVFVCKNPECNIIKKSDNFKVFRCQLPPENNFYVSEEPTDDFDWHPESRIEKFNDTCYICGCLGSFQCGKCKSLKYCSKEHQVLDWKNGHNETCCTDKTRSKTRDLCFPEYEILIDEEIGYNENQHGTKTEQSEEEKLKEFQELMKRGKAGTLQNVSSELLEEYALDKEDKFIKNFKSKLSLCPDQVLRYDRGGKPLWIAEPDFKEEDIPNCEYCNAPRQFEFQILPTLLNYLDVDELDKSLDWGNLIIYTCKSNCEEGPAYKYEYLWKQDIV